jgi:hypothetical protein
VLNPRYPPEAGPVLHKKVIFIHKTPSRGWDRIGYGIVYRWKQNLGKNIQKFPSNIQKLYYTVYLIWKLKNTA